jgi:hypothetical protein
MASGWRRSAVRVLASLAFAGMAIPPLGSHIDLAVTGTAAICGDHPSTGWRCEASCEGNCADDNGARLDGHASFLRMLRLLRDLECEKRTLLGQLYTHSHDFHPTSFRWPVNWTFEVSRGPRGVARGPGRAAGEGKAGPLKGGQDSQWPRSSAMIIAAASSSDSLCPAAYASAKLAGLSAARTRASAASASSRAGPASS